MRAYSQHYVNMTQHKRHVPLSNGFEIIFVHDPEAREPPGEREPRDWSIVRLLYHNGDFVFRNCNGVCVVFRFKKIKFARHRNNLTKEKKLQLLMKRATSNFLPVSHSISRASPTFKVFHSSLKRIENIGMTVQTRSIFRKAFAHEAQHFFVTT